MMRALSRDEELAMVLAHELGHILLHYQPGKLTRGKLNERAADYIGAHLASASGYRLTLDEFAIMKMAYADPGALSTDARMSHPSPPEREIAFIETLEEIEIKRQTGASLMPELTR